MATAELRLKKSLLLFNCQTSNSPAELFTSSADDKKMNDYKGKKLRWIDG